MTGTEVLIEPGRQDIVVTRTFDAPREVVFKAVTDPDLVPRWWGSRRFTTEVDRMETRVGGRWRFSSRDGEDGTVYWFSGVYHDVSPARIVATFEFEAGGPGHLQLIVDTFEQFDDGRTRYRSVALFQSVADRDGWLPTGMEDGIHESLARLDSVIQELR